MHSIISISQSKPANKMNIGDPLLLPEEDSIQKMTELLILRRQWLQCTHLLTFCVLAQALSWGQDFYGPHLWMKHTL